MGRPVVRREGVLPDQVSVPHSGNVRSPRADVELQLRFLVSAAIGASCGLSWHVAPIVAPKPGDELTLDSWPLLAVAMSCGAIVGLLMGSALLVLDRRPKALRRLAWAALPALLYGAIRGSIEWVAFFDLVNLALWVAVFLLAYAAHWLAAKPATTLRT